MTIEFIDLQRENGAVFADDVPAEAAALLSGVPAAAPLALHFCDSCEEYKAANESAVLIDLSDRTQIEITGDDRLSFLHNFCTNDINKLQPGEGCEAFITNAKARVLGHVFVFAGPTSLWLDSVPGQSGTLIDHLSRYVITEDVEIQDQTNDWSTVFVTGPTAIESLAHCSIAADGLKPGDNRLIEGSFGLGRVDWLGQPGFVLGLPRNQLCEIWSRLTSSGIRPCGSAAFHTLRIEAAFPWYGTDVSDGNLPQEVARNKLAVSFTKGCYLGQEPIARIDAIGHVNRELCRLQLSDGPLPAAGSRVLNAADENEIGSITSSARLTGQTAPVALAYLRTAHCDPGTAVVVQTEGAEPVPAVVSQLPFPRS
ncbi:MAG: folate-binding protein YgfZ [Planctomycetes bacterium]|nr:folate-binding protein YgfZ [Planctomycetota bacterium]